VIDCFVCWIELLGVFCLEFGCVGWFVFLFIGDWCFIIYEYDVKCLFVEVGLLVVGECFVIGLFEV